MRRRRRPQGAKKTKRPKKGICSEQGAGWVPAWAVRMGLVRSSGASGRGRHLRPNEGHAPMKSRRRTQDGPRRVTIGSRRNTRSELGLSNHARSTERRTLFSALFPPAWPSKMTWVKRKVRAACCGRVDAGGDIQTPGFKSTGRVGFRKDVGRPVRPSSSCRLLFPSRHTGS